MLRLAKTILLVTGGGCALLSAAGFVWILKNYLGGGAGLQILGIPISTTSVLIGWIHVVGLIVLTFLCFVIGVSLCAHGLAPAPEAHAIKKAKSAIFTHPTSPGSPPWQQSKRSQSA